MTRLVIRTITPFFRQISGKTIWSFLRVVAEDGLSGWGESTINGHAAALAGETVAQHAALVGTLVDLRAGVRPLSAGKLGWAVASAVDQACWDILAQRSGQPLATLLDPAVQGSVTLYANINRGTEDRSPAGFAATASSARQAGFAAVKLAPFDDLTPALAETAEGKALIRAGLDRIAAAAGAVGGAGRLMVDCHWRFTAATATETLREAARLGMNWFECPLPEMPENIPDLRRLRGIANALGVQLAGREEASLVAGFLPWAEAYDVMMPDVKYAGGLLETLRIAEALGERGCGFSLNNPTGSVCHAVSLHLSAACPPGLPLEVQWGETPLLYTLPEPALPQPRDGESALPGGSGHGAVLDPARLIEMPP